MKLFFTTFLLSLSFFAQAQTLEQDRLALIDFYKSTNGANWKNNTGWNINGSPGDNPCGWFGVSCNGGRVTGLNLLDNNLVGMIPLSIARINQLALLSLPYNNNLTGSLPDFLGQLTQLTVLNLSNSGMTGPIPNSYFQLYALRTLRLNEMKINGTISSKIGDLVNLTELNLSLSHFEGNIPNEIGKLTALEYLNLTGNQLTGSIPSAIGSMVRLTEIHLSDNQLSGPIPASLGNLKVLKSLIINNNKLSGAIPGALGNCTSLQDLSLNTNLLTGSLPTELGNLRNLVGFAAATNQLTGTLPADLSKCASLTDFNVFNNRISGTIPAAWANLRAFAFLSLGNNQLSGTLPAFIGSLPNLQYLYLQNNQFSGPFPAIPNIPEAGFVNIQYNRFTFEGIEQNAAKIDVFNPQTNLPVTFKNKVLSVSAGGNVADNTYRWLIGDVPVRTVTGDSTLALDLSGTYNVYVTNSKIPGATLLSDKYIYTASALPVKLIRFNAVAGGEGNVLTWTTAEETNNAGFTIEQSADGSIFRKIGFVAGKGADLLQHSYRFVDVKPFPVTYYRLRQLDHDGAETVSRIIHAGSAVAELNIYPNPAREQFIVESVRPAAIQVITAEGNVIFQSPKGSKHTISTSGWVPGNYIIRSGASSKKVIVSF